MLDLFMVRRFLGGCLVKFTCLFSALTVLYCVLGYGRRITSHNAVSRGAKVERRAVRVIGHIGPSAAIMNGCHCQASLSPCRRSPGSLHAGAGVRHGIVPMETKRKGKYRQWSGIRLRIGLMPYSDWVGRQPQCRAPLAHVTVTVTEALVLRPVQEDRGRITESIRILIPVNNHLGFLSIRRYRDIDRGCGNPAIIVAPRYRTIS